MASSAVDVKPQRYYLCKPLDAATTTRLRRFGKDEDSLASLRSRIKEMDDEKWKYRLSWEQLAIMGYYDDNPEEHRAEFERRMGVLQQNLDAELRKEAELTQKLSADKNYLWIWIVNSPLVLDPPFAIPCTTSQQIEAIHVIKTRIGKWPSEYIFRIALERSKYDLNHQLLARKALSLNLEILALDYVNPPISRL